MLNEFGVPIEPQEETIVAHDWRNEPIFSGDPDIYFDTDDGYLLDDPYEIEKYVKHVWGNPQHISEWEA